MNTLQFTQEIKDNWIEALESGNYKKGISRLRRNSNNTYCCLGVLAEIHPNLGIDSKGAECLFDNTIIKSSFTVLYPPFQDMLGSDMVNTLIAINDNTVNFSQVISIIRNIPVV